MTSKSKVGKPKSVQESSDRLTTYQAYESPKQAYIRKNNFILSSYVKKYDLKRNQLELTINHQTLQKKKNLYEILM